MMKLPTITTTLLALLILLGSSITAQASGNYHIEVVVFENTQQHSAATHSPNLSRALPSNAKTWHYATAYLNRYASKLNNSSRYRVIQHTAWGQRSADYQHSAAKQLAGRGMNGWVKVYAKSLLFTQLDLSFNGYQIKERRRLKLNEVHYFDNPGFGVLLRVSRAK